MEQLNARTGNNGAGVQVSGDRHGRASGADARLEYVVDTETERFGSSFGSRQQRQRVDHLKQTGAVVPLVQHAMWN